jgi:hypothetical protein
VAPNPPPGFISTPITQGRVDALYRYDLDAGDPDHELLAYSLAAGPAAMQVDPVTGVVSWLPEASGRFAVRFRVLDGRGGEAEQAFDIDILPAAPTPPVISACWG